MSCSMERDTKNRKSKKKKMAKVNTAYYELAYTSGIEIWAESVHIDTKPKSGQIFD